MEKIVYKNGKVEYSDKYTQLYYTNLPIRPSCGECQYSGIERRSDFTIGDYWGVQTVFPAFYDDRGVSLLFLNSDRALDIFENIKQDVDYIETDEEHAVLQHNLKKHSIIPKCKDRFWNDFNKKGIDYVLKLWSPYGGLIFKIHRKLMKIFKIW